MTTRRRMLYWLAAAPAFKLVGCSQEPTEAAQACQLLVLDDGHECTLCGMTIVRHAGPKGQACLHDGTVLPFCSVNDLLAWAWQPESKPKLDALHVHDLSVTDWDAPSDDAYMNAEQAIYVVGHKRRSAMGHSPASFSDRVDAERFALEYGGRLLEYPELNWETLG